MRSPLASSLAVLVSLLVPLSAPAVAAGPTEMPLARATGLRSAAALTPPPLRLAERFGVTPLASLTDASVGAGDQIEALRDWNRSGRQPFRAGFVRSLPLPRRVRFTTDALSRAAGIYAGGALVRTGPSTVVWGAEVDVADAYRLKLHLADLELPAGARIWVYGEAGDAKGPFGRELAADGGLWTPVVRGPVIRIEVELPTSPAAERTPGFTVDSVAEIFEIGPDGGPVAPAFRTKVDTSCLINASCVSTGTVPAIRAIQAATALVFFLDGNFVGQCTGGLLNSASQDPFFLTASHCIDTKASAASADLFWDYVQLCGGSVQTPSETFGADLLAAGTSSDYSLLRLDSIPSGRALLGWNANTGLVVPGAQFYRVSHPADETGIFPQAYARHRVLANPTVCSPGGDPRPIDDLSKFSYSETLSGGVLGGSSGAPLVTGSGQLVGQLLGGCGPMPAEGCRADTQIIDGRFSETFGFIGSWLTDPAGDGYLPPPTGAWLRSPDLPGFEAKVRITATSSIAGSLESDCIAETLCVSGALAGRPEVFVKVIGPRPNGYLWTQISRFTPSKVEVWLHQLSHDEINYYILDAVGSGDDNVSGLQDRQAYSP